MKKIVCFAAIALFVVTMCMPALAAGFVQGDGTQLYSVLPLDQLVVRVQSDETANEERAWLTVPYPGGQRNTAGVEEFFYTYQTGGTGVNQTQSRFTYLYGALGSVSGYTNALYADQYELQKGTASSEHFNGSFDRVSAQLYSAVIPVGLKAGAEGMAVPKWRITWPSGYTVTSGSMVASVSYLLSWWVSTEGEDGEDIWTVYTARYIDTMPIDLLDYETLRTVEIPALLDHAFPAGQEPGVDYVMISDYECAIDVAGVTMTNTAGNNVSVLDLTYVDYYTETLVDPNVWIPERINNPIPEFDFFTWIWNPVSSFLDHPFIFGVSIGQMFGAVILVLVGIILLKLFAGG